MNLVEKLVVLLVVGILSAIPVAGWLSFIRSVEISRAADRLHSQLYRAKSEARRDKTIWQFLVRQTPTGIQYSVNLEDTQPEWLPLPFKAEIDTANTTFYFDKKLKAYRMEFNYLGVSNGQLGRITIGKGKMKRCVIVSTLLGAMRTGKEDKKGKCN